MAVANCEVVAGEALGTDLRPSNRYNYPVLALSEKLPYTKKDSNYKAAVSFGESAGV